MQYQLYDACCVAAGHNQAGGQNEGNVNTLLHVATISGVLASLMRHFRASLSSLPLLSQPVGNLPIGTWDPDAQLPQLEGNFSEVGICCRSRSLCTVYSIPGGHMIARMPTLGHESRLCCQHQALIFKHGSLLLKCAAQCLQMQKIEQQHEAAQQVLFS